MQSLLQICRRGSLLHTWRCHLWSLLCGRLQFQGIGSRIFGALWTFVPSACWCHLRCTSNLRLCGHQNWRAPSYSNCQVMSFASRTQKYWLLYLYLSHRLSSFLSYSNSAQLWLEQDWWISLLWQRNSSLIRGLMLLASSVLIRPSNSACKSLVLWCKAAVADQSISSTTIHKSRTVHFWNFGFLLVLARLLFYRSNFTKGSRLTLAGTIQFAAAIQTAKRELADDFPSLFVPQSRPLSPGHSYCTQNICMTPGLCLICHLYAISLALPYWTDPSWSSKPLLLWPCNQYHELSAGRSASQNPSS